MEEIDLESKQSYLRENVLEKGYDADDFMSFLQHKKENGLNLNNWSMQELENAVKEFIKLKKEDEFEVIDEEAHDSEGETEKDINPSEIENINNELIFSKTEEFIKCKKIQETSISAKDEINIKITDPRKNDMGIFSKSYIDYNVELVDLSYKSRKRYSDFLWLNKILSDQYINCVLPPLCQKNFLDRFTDELISKRIRSLTKFLNGILIHPILKNSEVFNEFLSNDNLKKLFTKYNKSIYPAKAKDIITTNGEIQVTITKEKETYLSNIYDYTVNKIDILKKINKSYKNVIVLMQNISEKMIEISDLWKMAFDKSVKYYDCHNTSETYSIMSKLMKEWSDIQKKQIDILNINIREYFRYIKNEFKDMKNMSSRVINKQYTYKKSYSKLINNKENLFKEKEIEKWGLNESDLTDKFSLLQDKNLAFMKMLPKETQKVNDSKQIYGALLNSVISEFERIRALNSNRNKENVSKFLELLSENITKLHVCVADRSAEFYELKEKDNEANNKENKINYNEEKEMNEDNIINKNSK